MLHSFLSASPPVRELTPRETDILNRMLPILKELYTERDEATLVAALRAFLIQISR